jgi:hypothetical protein
MNRVWRLSIFALTILAAAALIFFAVKMSGALDKPGALPTALDFDPYWSAAQMAVHGQARAAYDNAAIEAFERAHTDLGGPGYLAFYYPPPFLLLVLPLALLPYAAALLVFEALQAALLWPLAKRILSQAGASGWGWLPVLAWPGFLMNIFSGQNGGLTASCFAGALVLLETRPAAAGACLGALVCKPQLALAVPVALVAARRWKTLFAAAGTAAALVAASLIFPGWPAWQGFLANSGAARGDLEHLPVKWPMMQSFYAGIRMYGGGLLAGYAGQAALAVIALALLAAICWRRRGAGPEMAALAAASVLITPFLYDYDLVLLTAPLAWAAGSAARAGFLPGEKALLLTLYIMPFAARAVGHSFGLPLAPLPVLALLFVIAHRAARQPARLVGGLPA